jgi:hypothetical protein
MDGRVNGQKVGVGHDASSFRVGVPRHKGGILIWRKVLKTNSKIMLK